MSKHANYSMNFDEIPSFSLGLTQDENINFVSCNNQPKESLNLQELRSKKRNDPQKPFEMIKRKAVRESLFPESKKIKKQRKRESQMKNLIQTRFHLIMNHHMKKRKLRRNDFGFDEDVPNKIIDQYFDDSRFIQKKELFVVVTDKIWGNENDEDAFKFANLYFIHGFLLSSVDIVIIPRLHFDLVDSQIPRLLNWKTNAICPRYESFMESLINDSNDKVVFKNIEPTRKEISTFQISKKVFHRGGSHKEDYVDFDDDFQDPQLKHQLSIRKKKYQGDLSNSPSKKKLKNQSKGVD
ncbi:hypothetical protein BC332_23499 [Capsicum chinense]|nr:hypothetical protein BC332_23499 [Capsicum chinense]